MLAANTYFSFFSLDLFSCLFSPGAMEGCARHDREAAQTHGSVKSLLSGCRVTVRL